MMKPLVTVWFHRLINALKLTLRKRCGFSASAGNKALAAAVVLLSVARQAYSEAEKDTSMARSNSNDTASNALLSRRRLLLRMGMVAGVAATTYAAPAMVGFDAARASGNSGRNSGGSSGASGNSRGNSGASRGASGNSRGNSGGSRNSRGGSSTGRADADANRLMRLVFGG